MGRNRVLSPRNIATACATFASIVVALRHQFYIANQQAGSDSCQNQLTQLNLCLRLYTKDFDAKLPPVDFKGARWTLWRKHKNPGVKIGVAGWADCFALYARDVTGFQCPKETHNGVSNPRGRNYTDYWYNRNLANIEYSVMAMPSRTLAFGDGNDGTDRTDATYSLSAFPPNWLSDSTKPPFRHLGGANYLFVDGHVAWLKPDEVSNAMFMVNLSRAPVPSASNEKKLQ